MGKVKVREDPNPKILPIVSDLALDSMIAMHTPGSLIWSALKQLKLIRMRKCTHVWEDAYTMSAEGIPMQGFRVCFKCGKIKDGKIYY